jgi:hypothetical protein
MRSLLLAASLLLPLAAGADEIRPDPETQATPQATDAIAVPSDAPSPETRSPEIFPADAAPSSSTTPTDTPDASSEAPALETGPQGRPPAATAPTAPTPLNDWSLQGFLNGSTVVLTQSPSQGTWRILTGASEILLVPTRREASIAGHPMPWPNLPLAPSDRASLHPGPDMPERGCRFWIEETPVGARAWCWDSQGRPLRIMTRAGDRWRLVFDATTRDSAPLWRILRAMGG